MAGWRLGWRYIDAPDHPEEASVAMPFPGLEPVREGYGFANRASLQAGAGVALRLTERTALRADVMRLLRNREVVFDPLLRTSIGVTWRF